MGCLTYPDEQLNIVTTKGELSSTGHVESRAPDPRPATKTAGPVRA